MGSKRLIVIACSCVVIALLVVVFIINRHSDEAEVTEAPHEAPAVSVVSAQTGRIASQLTVAGVFQPFQEVDVHGKVSGYIRHIYVDIGDRVRRGQTLAVAEHHAATE
jgi:multidrug efflux pump subunit AcrA (membrane-fusion protein)